MFRRAFRESAVGGLLINARERLETVIAESRLWGVVSRQFVRPQNESESHRSSEINRWVPLQSSTILTAIRTSRLVRTVGTLPATLQTASAHSGLSNLTTAGRRYVEGSWLYRWLTKEPDPDVIVIDLRETLTVGPWLAAIDRGMRWLLPAAASSILYTASHRGHALVTARPVQLVSLLAGLVAMGVLLAGVTAHSTPLVVVATALAVAAALGSRITWTWEDLQETRGYQTLAAAFEPPEPPERAETEHGDEDTDDTSASPPRQQ